ncbi:MAG: NBR1-Ig-like domain-containing protein [Anaerolineales bacterium]
MIKRLMLVTALTALLLSACGAKAPTATPAPVSSDTPVPTETQAIIATEPQATIAETATVDPNLPTATLEASPTSDVPRPTNPPDCKNSASFVADVTVPDNTEIEAGSTFVKTWRIANTGTCVWGPDYKLVHYSDERMGAPTSIPIPVTFPGQNADITISLTAPKTVGAHRANFVIKNPADLIIKVNDDSRLWLIIQVKDSAAPTVAPTAAVVPTNTQAAAVQPTNTSTTSGPGLVTATCSFSIDQSKLLQVINAVNSYRSPSGLPAYRVNVQLAKAAQSHANDMACNNLTTDTGSNSSTVEARVKASGYSAAFSAENLYFSNPPVTGQDAVNSWINNTVDQKYKLNLISDTYIDIGVGYAFFNNTGYYVIVFATP